MLCPGSNDVMLSNNIAHFINLKNAGLCNEVSYIGITRKKSHN